MRHRRATCLVPVLLLLAGCGHALPPATDTGRSPGDACRPLDADVLHQVSYDYDPVGSVAELLQVHDGAVVLGRVGGFTDGMPGHVLMRVAVDEVLREGAAGVLHDGAAHLYFWRGGTVAGTGRPRLDADDFARAVPRGTRLLAIVSPARPALQRRATLPAGAVLGETRVQGLHLGDCDRLVGGHDYLTPGDPAFRDLDALVAAVRRHLR